MRVLTLYLYGLLLCMAVTFVACGDSKDSDVDVESINVIQTENDKDMNIASDSRSVRGLLDLLKDESAFYVINGKIGSNKQNGYLYIRECPFVETVEKRDEIGIEKEELLAQESSQCMPLCAYFTLYNRHNKLENKEILVKLDTQKVYFEKDKDGFLKISGIMQIDTLEHHFDFMQDKTSPLNEIHFASASYEYSLKEDSTQNPIYFKSTYISPIILQSKNSLLKAKSIERLNSNLAQGARTLPELREKLLIMIENDFAEHSQKEEKFDTEYLQEYDVTFIDSKIISLEKFSYAYLGGAHGMHSREMKSYSISSGEELSNKIEDLLMINKKNKNELLRILTQRLETSHHKENLFNDSLPLKELPKTFLVTPNGITFIWHLYEIAPYVSGEIDINVEFEKLKSFINPNSPYKYLFDT